MALSPVILIATADVVRELKAEAGFERDILVFGDSESLRALEAISKHRPKVVVLEQAFAGTSRGAALINRLKTDPALAGCQIRVLFQASDYVQLVQRRAAAGLEPATAVPGDPLPPDYLGTRRARRFRIRGGVEVRLDGNLTKLIDLSATGAQVEASAALRPNQQVRVSMADEEQALRFAASVAWASFEPSRGESVPHYRVGMQFIDVGPNAIEGFYVRHRER